MDEAALISGAHKIDIFTADTPLCQATLAMVKKNACPSCEIQVHDISDRGEIDIARKLGIALIPSVVVDGIPLSHRKSLGVDEASLLAALQDQNLSTPSRPIKPK